MCSFWLCEFSCRDLHIFSWSCIICGLHLVVHVPWWISVLMLVSGFLRLDRVPQACWKVRTRSTTSVRLLHGVLLLPSGISSKMTISLDTITIIAMLVLSLLSIMSRCLPPVKYHPLNNAMLTFNQFDLANHWLAMLPLAQPCVSVASCRCSCFHVKAWVPCYITILNAI